MRLNGPLRGSLGGIRARAGGDYTQYEGDRRVLHPEMKMAGRAVTMAFMPARADLDQVVMANAKEKGIPSLHNRYVFDMLQPGGVMVVDLYGMKEGGAIVGISPMLMPCYCRPVHPTWITGVTLSAVDVPVRIGNVTMMSGDMYGSPRDPALRRYSQERLVEIKASRKISEERG
jgi:regulator of RNase E activity RraA